MEVKMKLADINRKNWTETLSLEWSATYRYKMQTAIFNNPRIVAIIDGIMRNESDHIDIAQKHLLPEFEPKVKGFQTILFFLYLNLEFERFANKSYAGFAREAEDPRSKEDFLRLVKSEGGHAKIFREMIEQIEWQFPGSDNLPGMWLGIGFWFISEGRCNGAMRKMQS